MPLPLERVRSPSDLADSGVAFGTCCRVGGRIEWLHGGELVLADALGSLRVRCPVGLFESLELGALAVLSVRREVAHWAVDAIEHIELFDPVGGDSEWARFARSGKAQRLHMRDRVCRAVRGWFEAEAFLEIDTPTWLTAPGLDSDVDPVAVEQGWLVTSPELCMKRLLVGGVPRLYQFAKCFRRGEQGPRHEAEFTMLEWYRAFSDLEQMLDDSERIIVSAASTVGKVHSIEFNGRKISLERPFLRLSVAEAFRRHASVVDVDCLARSDRNRYFQLFVDEVEPGLAEYDRPVFLHSYPVAEAALARVSLDDPRWAERAELYVAGVELCNAYSELNSAVEQRARFQAELERRAHDNRSTYPLDERFLSALDQGMPRSSGNALGFDRLMMLLLNTTTIEDVIAFPRSAL